MRLEPVLDKIVAFGWDSVEVNGNDMGQLIAALAGARAADGQPKAIVLRTTPGWGVPTLVARERAHFVRVDEQEWDRLIDELETNADQLMEAPHG